jgi:hypothetical protein
VGTRPESIRYHAGSKSPSFRASPHCDLPSSRRRRGRNEVIIVGARWHRRRAPATAARRWLDRTSFGWAADATDAKILACRSIPARWINPTAIAVAGNSA